MGSFFLGVLAILLDLIPTCQCFTRLRSIPPFPDDSVVETSIRGGLDGRSNVPLDRLDRQLLHALAIHGRAPFRRLAAVLESSEQTVARRYRRLYEAGLVRVLALPTPDPSDQGTLLRLQVQPGAARQLATALAKRPDVAWVGIMAGGTEIACGVRARTSEARDTLLLDGLPRTGRVLGTITYAMMHKFATPGRADWDGFGDPLTNQQQADLMTAEVRREPADRVPLSEEDEPLLAALATDGRVSYAALATLTGRPDSQIARRVEALFSSGALYLDVDIAAELLGFSTSARLYLAVAPSQLDAVGQELARHAETSFVAAVTGPANLAVNVRCIGLSHLYRYITATLGSISAIQAVETSLVVESLKQAGSLMRGPRIVSPLA
jgi:DNA-binding Lrp family transcriptional regulator